MIKKIAFLAVVSSVALFAFEDFDIRGEVVSTNPATSEVVMKAFATNQDITLQLNNGTKIKGDDCGVMGQDTYGKFEDLKVGLPIKAEVYGSKRDAPKTNYVAKEIEYKCR